MSRRLSAIVLSPESPYPPRGGGALRTASILEYLRERYDTTVLVFRQPGTHDPRADFPSNVEVAAVELPYHSKRPFPRALRNLRRACVGRPPLVDRFTGFEAQIQKACRGRSFDLGVVEHFWCAPYASTLKPLCNRLVLDLHNIESVLLARQAQTERGAASLLMHRFSRSCARLERRWLGAYDLLLTPSFEDAKLLPVPAAVVPNTIPLMPLPDAVKGFSVAISGSFEYQPNMAAVRWFAIHVWPALRSRYPDLGLRLIGRGGQSVAHLFAGDAAVEFSGEIEDAVAELAQSRAALVPVHSGSGTRIKMIEAWAAGLPVVATTIGAEGMPGEAGVHWLEANSPAAFIASVSRVLTDDALCDALGKSGRLLYEEKLTWQAAHRALAEAGL